MNSNIEHTLRTTICTLFLFAFGVINATEDFVIEGMHISLWIFNHTLKVKI